MATGMIIVAWVLFGATALGQEPSCEDVTSGCTINPTCLPDGRCGGQLRPDGTPCDPGLGGCATQAQCFFGFCVPMQFVECEADADPCTVEACNPFTGSCESFPMCPDTPCATRECVGGTCRLTPRNEGASCVDGNPCTSNERCTAGDCVAQTTPTLPCVGDCSFDGLVTIGEVVITAAIFRGVRDVADCPPADSNLNGMVAINEVVQASNSFRNPNDCPRIAPGF